MKALFGVVSLLVVLALVALLAVRQMKAGVPAMPPSTSGAEAGATSPGAASANVREQARQLQERVQGDVTKALEQGAAARQEASDK